MTDTTVSTQSVVLPVKEAYRFGAEHGLAAEIDKIRTMEIEWDLSYTTTVRRGYLISLFSQHGIFDAFKEKCWPAGNTAAGTAEFRRLQRVMQRYQQFLKTGEEAIEPTPDDASDAESQAFSAESDLRNFLEKNPGCIEKGLRIYSSDGISGVEYQIDGGKGRIDLLAVDANGRFVVIELKVSRGRNRALGQLLYYMGWVDEHLPNSPCRGIVIAREITDDLLLAVRRVPEVSLCRYDLSVSIVPITTISA